MGLLRMEVRAEEREKLVSSKQLVRVLFSRKKSMLGNSMNRVKGNCQAGIQVTVSRAVLSRN